MILLALHLSDGFLPFEWCAAGFAAAFALVILGCWRLRDEDVPSVALVTAAFFVSSAIHVPLPPTSAHLLLNGLVGAILGWRAGVAIFIGLLLQVALLGHGGWTTLGLNTLVMSLPALAIGMLFRAVLPTLRRDGSLVALVGGLLGLACVLSSLALQSLLIWFAGEHHSVPAIFWFGAHLPLAALEGAIVAVTVGFLVRVKPELLGLSPSRPSLTPPPANDVAPVEHAG